MATNNKKKKTIAAVATAAVLLLGGTFAWQSISQTALNEASDVVNPGGRLHDDFNGTNKDVYVENFAEDDIFARVRLEEYFEITMNKGTDAEKTEIFTQYTNEEGEQQDSIRGKVDTYATHIFGVEDSIHEYWDWTTGGSKVFMPTFNKNKDSLKADINGTYNGKDGIVTDATDDDRYKDYKEYATGETVTADASYDADSNMVEDDGIKNVSEEHVAKNTLDATLISMDEWFALDPAERKGYWVYDTDGWVYWSGAIPKGEATGLLLDGIELNQVMDDSWYYAINVVAQFVTADDLGSPEDNNGQGSGFYKKDEGPAPSDNALKLLESLGVNITGEESEEEFVDEGTLEGINLSLYSNNENIKVSEKSNTLLVKPVYGWNKVDVKVAFGDLDLILADTTQAIYEWDEASGTYVEHSENVVDIGYYDDGLDLFLSEDALGRYKLTASYDDNGTVYNGELEFTIKVETEEEEPGTGGDDPGTGGDDPVGVSFSTTDDLNATPYAILTKSETNSDEHEMTFVRSYTDLTEGTYTYNDKTVEDVFEVDEIDGGNPEWNYYHWEDYGDGYAYGYKISSVEFANAIAPKETLNWFYGFNYLESITFGSKFDGSNLEDMASMFAGGYGTSLKSVDMSAVDCQSREINVQSMFREQSQLEEVKLPKNLKATDIGSVFYQCNALAEIEGLETWDVSECENMNYVFWCCYDLESLDISTWDTSAATEMAGMFGVMSKLTSIDLSNLDTSRVTNMEAMFRSCENLEAIVGADKWNVSNVTNMKEMFIECGQLTLNCEGWNVTQVNNHDKFSSASYYDNSPIATITQPNWQ